MRVKHCESVYATSQHDIKHWSILLSIINWFTWFQISWLFHHSLFFPSIIRSNFNQVWLSSRIESGQSITWNIQLWWHRLMKRLMIRWMMMMRQKVNWNSFFDQWWVSLDANYVMRWEKVNCWGEYDKCREKSYW